MNAAQQYLDLFASQRALIDRHAAPLLNAPRTAAAETLAQTGFPGQKVERYRYTPMEEVFAPDYGLNLSRVAFPSNPYDVFSCDVPNLSTLLFFVVNDTFYVDSRRCAALPEGVVVASLRQAAEQSPQLVARVYGQLAQAHSDAIDALNTMLVQDGVFVYVPQGVKVDKTIQIVNIFRSDVDLMANRRLTVLLEAGAEARILACDHAVDSKQFLSTQVGEVLLGEGAALELYELEETHTHTSRVANLYVRQAACSRFTHANLTLHNGLSRNFVHVRLEGEGASASLFGSVIADQRQRVDNHTVIHHIAPRCTSRELYKCVLDDEARGAFAGRILVNKGAQQTASQENCATLLGSRTARMWSQPMLEIYADDVKCSHGSTVGQMNDAALFYMQQRGIDQAEARMLLKTAFVAEVLEAIPMDALRARLSLLVEKRFRGELSKCRDCKLCK